MSPFVFFYEFVCFVKASLPENALSEERFGNCSSCLEGKKFSFSAVFGLLSEVTVRAKVLRAVIVRHLRRSATAFGS